MHEKRMCVDSAFVTLTYADENLPVGGSLVKRDLQLFMKRLRKRFGSGIRFYGCGEYGGQFDRPHYHVLLFNFRVTDGVPVARAKGGQTLYSSEEIAELWRVGHHWIGEVNFDSCAYVARYILKKVTGSPAEAHYQVVTVEGEIVDREPEFTVMSRRPGIGSQWFDRYHVECYNWDSVIMNAQEARPPRYYDNRFDLIDTVRLEALKVKRRRAAMLHRADNTTRRLRVREVVTLRRLALFQRRELYV